MPFRTRSSSFAFKLVLGFHARMNDLRLEREQNQAGVEALACLERGLDPVLGCGCGRLAVCHGERLPADSAIAKEHGCFAVILRGRILRPSRP